MKLTARVCDLSDGQAAKSHRGQEGVRAPVGRRERRVVHVSPRQHQSVVEQEQAHIRHLLEGPDEPKNPSIITEAFIKHLLRGGTSVT